MEDVIIARKDGNQFKLVSLPENKNERYNWSHKGKQRTEMFRNALNKIFRSTYFLLPFE